MRLSAVISRLLQLKTDIDAQKFAVSLFKPSIFGGNFVMVAD